jgi:hypothetical protein
MFRTTSIKECLRPRKALFLEFVPKKAQCINLRFGHALYVNIHRDADLDQWTFSSVALTTPARCLRRR